MKINSLEIDGYGVWSGLRLNRLSEGLNVVYGPNEAGKTTLLEFIRSTLYGFSPDRRHYLPPVHGGRGGGWLDVTSPNGSFQIDRYDDADSGPGAESLTITATDGTRQGEHMLKVLLANLDESVFNNVFAVGLREIQELGTLGDTEAAELLYNITAGLDRVSLVEVTRALETLRNHILDRDGGPCRVAQLLADREKIRQEIEELQTLTLRYARLVGDRTALDRDVTRIDEEKTAAQQQLRVVELAADLRDRWARRAELDGELDALGPQAPMPPDAVARMDAIKARIEKYQKRAERIDRQREELRHEGAGLEVNESLGRQAARVEAMLEQEPWITTIQGQVAALEKQRVELESALAAEYDRLGLAHQDGERPVLSAKAIRRLRVPGRALGACRDEWKQARQMADAAGEQDRLLGQQIDAALGARSERDLAAATDRAGNLVAQLRRRIQIDDRLEQTARYHEELQEQGRRFMDQQMLPGWVLGGLGVVFVLGVLLLIIGLFFPASMTGSAGWALIAVGLVSAVGAVGGKTAMQRSNARQLEACRKQIHLLESQIKQAKDERDALDSQLPHGGGPLASRLATAEQDLAALEELAPLETRRTAARQDAAAATRRAAEAQQQHRAARRTWSQGLSAAGLPKDMKPRQLGQVARRCDPIRQMQQRTKQIEDDLAQRRRDLDMLVGRVGQLVADCQVEVASDEPLEQLHALAEALTHEQARVARRESIRRRLRQLRHHRARQETTLTRLRHRRRELFRESGVDNEADLRTRAAAVARVESLRGDRDALEQEIVGAIGDRCSQQAIRQQLEDGAEAALTTRRDEARTRLEAIERELHARIEQRGQLSRQMTELAEDRRLAGKQLDLGVVEQQLAAALRHWQVLAITGRVLEEIRTAYEHERQPETLQEASSYLDRLTQGRYHRVWTPLGERALRVDDSEGRSLPVEVLSRGTREQLFLSLRLALAAYYARRGAPLPLVLDDVLVNFDADRAKAAATVLRDFAAAGHQLLVFTCHEHIARLFKSIKAPVAALPDNAQGEHAALVFDEAPREKPKRVARQPSSPKKPAKVAAAVAEPDPDEDRDDDGLEEAESDDSDELSASPDSEPWEEEVGEAAATDDLWEEEADGESFGDSDAA